MCMCHEGKFLIYLVTDLQKGAMLKSAKAKLCVLDKMKNSLFSLFLLQYLART